MSAQPSSFDFQVAVRGSISTIYPLTDSAREWLAEYADFEDWQFAAGGLACDPRCALQIATSMVAAGLTGEVST